MPSALPFAPTRCAAMLMFALATGLLAAPPAAAQTVGAMATLRDYDLPAGPLATMLNRIAREAGLVLTVDARLLQGRNAAPVQGRFEAVDALRRALADSGLELAAATGGTYTVRQTAQPMAGPPASPQTQQGSTASLPEVNVTADATRDGTTEGSGSYGAAASSTATRLNLSPRETPQTITTITRQQMDDAGMTSVEDALKATSGIFLLDRGTYGNTYQSRAFDVQTQYDGVAVPIGLGTGHLSPQIDSAFADRVEVLQGAAGLLTGAGQPGGTINLVRKRPTATFQANAEVQLGSWSERRVMGDISGPLAASGRVRGRLVAVVDNRDSFTDHVYRNRRGVYGIVEADLTATTQLEASVQYQQDKRRNQYGVPFAADGSDAGLARSSFFDDANQRHAKAFKGYTIGLSQRLPNDWLLKAVYSRQATDNDLWNASSITGRLDPATGDGMSMRRMLNFQRHTRTNVVDAHASGPFHLAGRKHELALGLNGWQYRDEWAGTGYLPYSPINVYAFDPAALGPVPDGGTPYSAAQKTTSFGAYGVARWNLTDSLKLITGVRVSNYEQKNVVTGRVAPKETGVVTPYAGLIYDINAQYSAYVSHADIFSPQSNRGKDGTVLDPVVGTNYEAGIKGELLDKRLNVSAAVFRLEQKNLARQDDSVPSDTTGVCGGSCYIAADKVVSQGVDLGVSGQIGRNWNLSGGYTYTNAEYATGTRKGERYGTQTPQHSLRLAAHYHLPGTAWSMGANVAATSKTYRISTSAADPWTIRQGALVLIGLNANYRITPKTQVNFLVSNLTDRRYRYMYERNNSPFGEPRKLWVGLRHQF